MSHHRHTGNWTRSRGRRAVTAVALATALLAIVPPGGVSAQQDLRSPDARDAALASEAPNYRDLRSPDARHAALASEAPNYRDLRSPDARDAALASEAPSYQDLRSPDARDSGRVPSSHSLSASPTGESGGTDWGDVAIVAGGMLLLLGAAGVVLFGRRRSSARKARTAVVSS
jgi:hypothetical protein